MGAKPGRMGYLEVMEVKLINFLLINFNSYIDTHFVMFYILDIKAIIIVFIVTYLYQENSCHLKHIKILVSNP